jgi:hypothetical protein
VKDATAEAIALGIEPAKEFFKELYQRQIELSNFITPAEEKVA